MANPDPIDLTQGTVTKICTNVANGWIRNISRDTPIFYTTRLTGESAPSAAAMQDEGVLLFAEDGINEQIASSEAIDIYVISPSDSAKIRVDLP